MKLPKTTKGLLILLISIAETVPTEYKGDELLTDEERSGVYEILAAIQNRLGEELKPVLDKFNLTYKG